MIVQLHSELLKIRTTVTVGVLLGAAAALTLLAAAGEGISADLADLAADDGQRTVFTAATSATFFATFAGVLLVTGEFRYGTIRPTLIFEPRRRVVLASKLATGGLVGLVFAIVCVGLAQACGHVILAARGVDLTLSASAMLALTGGPILASTLSAMIGVALGTLIRNQVGAIIAVAAYAFLVDAVTFSVAPSVGRILPGKAGDGLSGMPDDHLLAPGPGAAVLAAWTLAFVVAAAIRADRSDV